MRGYPLGTVAYNGPNDTRAAKVVAGIRFIADANLETRKRFLETGDARTGPVIAEELLAYFVQNRIKSVALMVRIFD